MKGLAAWNLSDRWLRESEQGDGEWKVRQREELDALRERILHQKEVRRNERYDG